MSYFDLTGCLEQRSLQMKQTLLDCHPRTDTLLSNQHMIGKDIYINRDIGMIIFKESGSHIKKDTFVFEINPFV